MLPYWLFFTMCAAGALEHRRGTYRVLQGGPLFMLVGLFAAVFIGLRYQVGGDWETYLQIFENFRYGELGVILFRSDPGFSALNWLAHQFGAGIWLVNLVCAAIFAWGLIRFARTQPNPWLVLVVAAPYLIIVVAMGYTRQAVAIGFLLAGLSVLHRRSIPQFMIYLALATTFHKSAVIVVPLVALAILQQRLWSTILIALLGLLLYRFLLEGSVEKLVVNYVEAEYESEGAAVRLAMNLVPAAIFLVYSARFALPPVEARLWKIFSWAAVASMVMLYVTASSTAVDRIALYLIPLQLVVLARLPYAFGRNGTANGQVAFLVVAYSALVQFVWLTYATHAYKWVPYQFYPFADFS